MNKDITQLWNLVNHQDQLFSNLIAFCALMIGGFGLVYFGIVFRKMKQMEENYNKKLKQTTEQFNKQSQDMLERINKLYLQQNELTKEAYQKLKQLEDKMTIQDNEQRNKLQRMLDQHSKTSKNR